MLAGTQLTSRAGLLVGLGLLPAGLVLFVLALPAASLALFMVGIVIGGFGVGLAFKAALALVSKLAPDAQRGEVVSSFFVASYLGITLPVIGVGVLTSLASTFAAAVTFAVVVALLAATAAAIVARRSDVGSRPSGHASPRPSGPMAKPPGAW